MPAPELSVEGCAKDYGLEVSDVDLADAAEQIHIATAFTLDEHVDSRTIPQGNVRRAWAIVAHRIHVATAGDPARDVVSETDGSFSYTVAEGMLRGSQMNVVAGLPMELLDMGRAQWYNHRERGNVLPPETDDFGTEFPTV